MCTPLAKTKEENIRSNFSKQQQQKRRRLRQRFTLIPHVQSEDRTWQIEYDINNPSDNIFKSQVHATPKMIIRHTGDIFSFAHIRY